LQIVHNDFPLPALPLPAPAPLPSTIDPEVVASTPPRLTDGTDEPDAEELPDASDNEPPPNSQSSTKENDEPIDIAARPPPLSGFEVDPTHHPVQPPDSIEAQPGTLPPDLLSLYQYSARTLERDFANSPPYTIQRLAELVLYPKRHYRFLPAYLRALDRTVSVTSPLSEFPLPTLNASANGGFLTNGDTSAALSSAADGLGSDESLGGALLTPIPWLRNAVNASNSNTTAGSQEGELHSESTETIEGPHGAGSIETVSVTVNGVPSAVGVPQQSSSTPASPTLSEQSDASTSSTASAESTEAQLRQQGGVTQGELLRQEQEAGVVPVSQSGPRRSLISGGAVAVGRVPVADSMANTTGEHATDISMDERPIEETPHARGPEVIGMEDMGPQKHELGGGLDMEAAVGRAKSPPQASVQHVQSVSTQPITSDVPSAPRADAKMEEAHNDDAGKPGMAPDDVTKEDALRRTAEQQEKQQEAVDEDGDVMVTDADGRPAGEAKETS
jgi:hypothetical protein